MKPKPLSQKRHARLLSLLELRRDLRIMRRNGWRTNRQQGEINARLGCSQPPEIQHFNGS